MEKEVIIPIQNINELNNQLFKLEEQRQKYRTKSRNGGTFERDYYQTEVRDHTMMLRSAIDTCKILGIELEGYMVGPVYKKKPDIFNE